MSDIRILVVADTHLGFDLPMRPRVERRRRGHDFFANYATVLQPALDGDVDVVVHGGDVFDRPTVMPTLAYQALEPLRRVAERGVPVFIVPGTHERSFLPHSRFAAHPNVHIFDRPRTFVVEARGATLALSGFPYERSDVRTKFRQLVADSEWQSHAAATRERTSFAEMDEPKGYMIVTVGTNGVSWGFRQLPARPQAKQVTRLASSRRTGPRHHRGIGS